MRIPMIAGNWKMNTTISEAVELVREMHGGIHAAPHVDRVVSLCLPECGTGDN